MHIKLKGFALTALARKENSNYKIDNNGHKH
jgi:hypothetical protein